MAYYDEIYLQLDVLLLAEYFEKFGTTSLIHYSPDSTHYYTAPGFSWDTALRKSRVDFELITDVDVVSIDRELSVVGFQSSPLAMLELMILTLPPCTIPLFYDDISSIW